MVYHPFMVKFGDGQHGNMHLDERVGAISNFFVLFENCPGNHQKQRHTHKKNHTCSLTYHVIIFRNAADEKATRMHTSIQINTAVQMMVPSIPQNNSHTVEHDRPRDELTESRLPTPNS